MNFDHGRWWYIARTYNTTILKGLLNLTSPLSLLHLATPVAIFWGYFHKTRHAKSYVFFINSKKVSEAHLGQFDFNHAQSYKLWIVEFFYTYSTQFFML